MRPGSRTTHSAYVKSFEIKTPNDFTIAEAKKRTYF